MLDINILLRTQKIAITALDHWNLVSLLFRISKQPPPWPQHLSSPYS